MGKDGLHGEFQKTVSWLEHGYKITTDPPMDKWEQTKLLEGCLIRGMRKAFHELHSNLRHLFQCLFLFAKFLAFSDLQCSTTKLATRVTWNLQISTFFWRDLWTLPRRLIGALAFKNKLNKFCTRCSEINLRIGKAIIWNIAAQMVSKRRTSPPTNRIARDTITSCLPNCSK